MALVFIGMMLRKEQDKQERIKKETRKTKGRLQVSTEKKNIEITILYDAWTLSTHDACSNAMRIGSIAP